MNAYDMKGRAAIVTGGAKGIGLSTAERILESGGSVSLWDLDGGALEAAKAKLSERGRVETVVMDAADPAAVEAAGESTIKAFGTVDILIANAGVAGTIKPAWELSLADWDRLIRLDLTSVFLACRTIVPHMLQQDYGRIVIVSSIAGMEGAANNAAYSAAKAGAIGFTKALGKELATSGIIVNCVTPSGIETGMLADVTKEYLSTVLARMPMNRLGQPEEAAALIAWLASEDCSFSTGAVFDLSGGRAVY